MTTRMNPYVKQFGLVKPLIDLGLKVEGYGLEKSLMELVKIRASQINGCGVCLDMHAKDAISRRRDRGAHPDARRLARDDRCTTRASRPHWPGPKR